MDIHDGNIVQWDGLYWWVGMGYGNCSETTGIIPPIDCPGIYEKFGKGCGFREDHSVNVYSSPDLLAWTPHGDALPVFNRTLPGIYFRPKVLFNSVTNQWVLWINYLPPAYKTPLAAYPHARYVVATADTPMGPYSVATANASMAQSGGGDFAVLVGSNNFNFNFNNTVHRVRRLVQLAHDHDRAAHGVTKGGGGAPS